MTLEGSKSRLYLSLRSTRISSLKSRTEGHFILRSRLLELQCWTLCKQCLPPLSWYCLRRQEGSWSGRVVSIANKSKENAKNNMHHLGINGLQYAFSLTDFRRLRWEWKWHNREKCTRQTIQVHVKWMAVVM